MESYGSYFKRMFGRVAILAALVVFLWVVWMINSDENIRKAAGVSYGNRAQLIEAAETYNE